MLKQKSAIVTGSTSGIGLGIARAMAARGASHHFISTVDDVAWLLNLRGADVSYNPVFLAHLLIGAEAAGDGADVDAGRDEFGGRRGEQLALHQVGIRVERDEGLVARERVLRAAGAGLQEHHVGLGVQPHLLALEEHPGLVHLVSNVRGELREGTGWAQLLDATFPGQVGVRLVEMSPERVVAEVEVRQSVSTTTYTAVCYSSCGLLLLVLVAWRSCILLAGLAGGT